MGKKSAHRALPGIKDLVAGIQESEAGVRSDGIRSFCPCHAGWEVFEQNIRIVLRHLKNPDRLVRADALHVFEDAARMQIAEDLKYYVASGETKVGEKRAARYRSIQERLEARRDRRISKNKGNRSAKGRPQNLR